MKQYKLIILLSITLIGGVILGKTLAKDTPPPTPTPRFLLDELIDQLTADNLEIRLIAYRDLDKEYTNLINRLIEIAGKKELDSNIKGWEMESRREFTFNLLGKLKAVKALPILLDNIGDRYGKTVGSPGATIVPAVETIKKVAEDPRVLDIIINYLKETPPKKISDVAIENISKVLRNMQENARARLEECNEPSNINLERVLKIWPE